MELGSRRGAEQVEVARGNLGVHLFERPDVVVPEALATPEIDDGAVEIKLPPMSLTTMAVEF